MHVARPGLRDAETPEHLSLESRVVDAERNRPASIGREARTEAGEGFRLAVRDSFTAEGGKTPAEVADIVLDGQWLGPAGFR